MSAMTEQNPREGVELRDIPAMSACYALVAVLAWIVYVPGHFVATVTGWVS